MVLIAFEPQPVFHPHIRKMILIYVRRLQASLLWTLTPCLFSAVHPQQHLDHNTAEMETNGGRAEVVLVNRSPFHLQTITLAAHSLPILAQFSEEVGRRFPLSWSLLNSGRNLSRHKQMFRLHLPLRNLSPPPLHQWISVKLQWQMEKSQEHPTNTAAHSAQQASHQP